MDAPVRGAAKIFLVTTSVVVAEPGKTGRFLLQHRTDLDVWGLPVNGRMPTPLGKTRLPRYGRLLAITGSLAWGLQR